MMIRYVTYNIVLVLLVIGLSVRAQKLLTLNESIERALSSSISFKKATTALETSQWKYKDYQSYLRPQLGLAGTLPFYRKESIPIFQQDGSLQYRKVNQSQSSLKFSLDQGIAATGGQLFLSSELSRADNFDPGTQNFGTSPILIGYEQPVSGFNELKWARRLEPVRYTEGMKEYIEERENISFATTGYFFDWLLAQINLEMASSNLSTADTILMIGKEKFSFGQISKNELLQLQLAVIHSKKAVSNALLDIQSASVRLQSYTGLEESFAYQLVPPDDISGVSIDSQSASRLALENSQMAIELKRKLLEAERFSSKTRKESGLNANLSFKYGLTDVGDNLSEAYTEVQTLQTFSLNFSMPIVDWSRQRARRKTAEASLKLAQYTMAQERENLRQQIIAVIERFEMLQELVVFTQSADEISQSRFEIAKKRYLLGDIGITDLNIARDEKDRGKRDYIQALRSYWESYYLIRILTLYDFEKQVNLKI